MVALSSALLAVSLCVSAASPAPQPADGTTSVCLFLGTGQGKDADPERAGLRTLEGTFSTEGMEVGTIGWGGGTLSFLAPRWSRGAEECLASGARRILAGYSLGARAALREARANRQFGIDVLFLIAPMGKDRFRVPANVRLAVVACRDGVKIETEDPRTRAVSLHIPDAVEEDGWWKLAPGADPLREHMQADNAPCLLGLLRWLAEEVDGGRLPETAEVEARAAALLAPRPPSKAPESVRGRKDEGEPVIQRR